MNTNRYLMVILGVALSLTVLFWGPLWCGYGFVGGDVYSYFFPQKAYLADCLRAGEFPLWNNLTGFGYPTLGESQTGVAYPPHLMAYSLFPLNTAYNFEHLLHYVLCFTATALFARRIGLATSGSVFMALVFTYGWFPPRACLEWAIITGAWLPLALWCVESFVQTRAWRYSIGLSLTLGLQLLAGHFHVAFMTQMLVVVYGAFRVLGRHASARTEFPVTGPFENDVRRRKSGTAGEALVPVSCPTKTGLRVDAPLAVSLGLSLVAGFLLASIQLLPAWELKTRSSRATVGAEHDPAYGHLPPLYLSQLIAPWLWYSPLAIDGEDTIRTISEFAAPWHWFGPSHDLEQVLQSVTVGSVEHGTNKIEAHLYCGLVPLGLAVCWLVGVFSGTSASRPRDLPRRNKENRTSPGVNRLSRNSAATASSVATYRLTLFWLIAGTMAVVYATGWLIPLGRSLPGFNFFRGPGRYGLITTLAISVFAGHGLEMLVNRCRGPSRRLIIALVFTSTFGDLWLVSRMVTNVVMVAQPPISFRDNSPVRRLLLAESSVPRLYIPGQNVGNLLGVSCLPVYLGIAPSEYGDPWFAGQGMPRPLHPGQPIRGDVEFLKVLIQSGVTHLLTFDPLDPISWRSTPIWSGIDPLLNRAWGRQEPLYLYRIETEERPTRVGFADNRTPAKISISVEESNRIVLESSSSEGGELVLKDLAYPGWRVQLDGKTVEPLSSSGDPFRHVAVPPGVHQVTWRFRPKSVTVGALLSLITVILLATLGHLRFWHLDLLNRLLAKRSAAGSP